MQRAWVLICLINIACTISLSANVVRRSLQLPPENTQQAEAKVVKLEENDFKPHVLHIDTPDNANASASAGNTSNVVKDSKLNNVTNASSTNITGNSEGNVTLQSNVIIPARKPTVDSEALLRGFYVFIGLSVVALLYVMYRSYRLRLGGNRPTTVRKYGILTQRTDMEMLPLPLDDDDEDDTVFDVGSHTYR